MKAITFKRTINRWLENKTDNDIMIKAMEIYGAEIYDE